MSLENATIQSLYNTWSSDKENANIVDLIQKSIANTVVHINGNLCSIQFM